MDTTKTLVRIRKLKEKKERQKKFNKYKKYVLKLHPESTLHINSEGNFYLLDSDGYRLLQEEYSIPDCDTPYITWEKKYNLLWTKHIVDRNNRKFSPERNIDFTGSRLKNNI
jgi:hypothetical protein